MYNIQYQKFSIQVLFCFVTDLFIIEVRNGKSLFGVKNLVQNQSGCCLFLQIRDNLVIGLQFLNYPMS